MEILNSIKAVDGVKSVSFHAPSNRYYINLRGNGSAHRGEQTSKLYLTAAAKLVWERGKGATSAAYDTQRDAVEAVCGGMDIQ